MIFKDNNLYKEVFHSKVTDVRFYMPADIANGYHLSRQVAAGAQDIYSGAGATKATLKSICEDVIRRCNNEKSIPTLRTDIGTLMNNILYRLEYPLDEDCAIRMGAIFTFMEGEDPNQVHNVVTQNKVDMAKKDPDLYAFFLHTGAAFTPSYRELLETLTERNLIQRSETLATLQPPSQSS